MDPSPSGIARPLRSTPLSLATRERQNWLLLSLLIAMGAFLRLHILGVGSLWQADCFSIALAQMPWPTFLREMWWGEANMAFYYFLLRGWLRLGDSQAWLQGLSVLFGVLTIPAVYALGKRFLTAETGLIGAALLAIHNYHISHSEPLRAYSLWPLLIVLSTYSFLALLESPDRKVLWALYVLFSSLAIYTQVFTIFVLCAQWLALTPGIIKRIGVLKILAAIVTIGILTLPIALVMVLNNNGQLNWVPRLSAGGVWYVFQGLIGNEALGPQGFLAGLLLSALEVPAWIIAIWGARHTRNICAEEPTTRTTVSVLAWCLFFPLMAMTAISFVKPILYPRYVLMCVPAAVLLAGQGLTTIEQRIPRGRQVSFVTLLVMIALALLGARRYDANLKASGADWRVVTKYILDHQEPDDAVIFHSFALEWAYDYYVRRERETGGPATAPPVLSPLTFDRRSIEHRTEGYRRVWLVMNQGLPTPQSNADIRILTETLQGNFHLKEKKEFVDSATFFGARDEIQLFLYDTGPNFRWLGELPASTTGSDPAASLAVVSPGPLVVSSANPRYFADPKGNIVYLAGSHVWANLVDRGTINPPPAFDYDGYMAFMKNHGFNWMRLWTREFENFLETPDRFATFPHRWLRTGPDRANDGDLRYDFTQLNQKYFGRMRARIIQAGQNGIYTSIMLFNGFEWARWNSMNGDPFERRNNVNGINCSGACPSNISSIPAQALTYEKNYIHKVIDTVHDLPNVMYEISNESPEASTDWQNSLITEVNRYEQATYATHHPIGFTFQYPDGTDTTLLRSAADWISPKDNIPTSNGTKVIINDTDHSYGYPHMERDGANGNIAWAWKNFANGNNIAFMDPYLVVWPGRNNCTGAPVGGDPGICTGVDRNWNPIRLAMQDVLVYAKKIDLKNMTPQGSLSTSGFCLANRGLQYLVFSTSTSFTLTTVAGTYTFEWFNPLTHMIVQAGSVAVGNSQNFTAPIGEASVLWLHK
jgi:hypothetical protein